MGPGSSGGVRSTTDLTSPRNVAAAEDHSDEYRPFSGTLRGPVRSSTREPTRRPDVEARGHRADGMTTPPPGPPSFSLENPYLHIRNLDNPDESMQRQSGIYNEYVTDDDAWGKSWMRKELELMIRKWQDPYYHFFKLVSGLVRISVTAKPGVDYLDAAALNSISQLSKQQTDEIVKAMGTKEMTDANPDTTKPQTIIPEVAIPDRWNALMAMYRRDKISPDHIKVVNEIFPNPRPNTYEWSSMIEHIGHAEINADLIAAIEVSYHNLVRENRATRESLCLEVLMTGTEIKSQFANLVALYINYRRVLNMQNMGPLQAQKEAKATYHRELYALSNLVEIKTHGHRDYEAIAPRRRNPAPGLSFNDSLAIMNQAARG